MQWSTIERDATTTSIGEVAQYLQEHLSQKLTAYLAGINDVKVVGRWIAESAVPRPDSAMRLRAGYYASRILVETYGDETARAWLVGSKAALDDQAPAYVLRTATDPSETALIVRLAREFVGTDAIE